MFVSLCMSVNVHVCAKDIHLERVRDTLTIAAFSATESRLGKLAKEPYKTVIKMVC